MKTKFDRFKLNESTSNEKLDVNKYRGEISNDIDEIISWYSEKMDLNYDVDAFNDCDDIYNLTQNIIDSIIKTLENTLPKFEYDSYEYQKYCVEKIMTEDWEITIEDFLKELKDNDAKLNPKIKEEYDHLFNANNMGLI